MATQSKGSALYKILILILVVGLIFVILIPAKIWKQEKVEMTSAQYNMMSIYEAEKYYHRLTKSFTSDKAELLSVIKEDSTLKQVQELVNHTQNLKNLLDSYQNIPYLKSLLIIDQNISTISNDLENNQRWFKTNESIKANADKLSQTLMTFNSDLEYPNYVAVTNILDTLYQLRRDLSDYNLQIAASKCADLSQRLNSVLPNIEFDNFQTLWAQAFIDLTDFRKEVDASDISQQTSVAARIREFSVKINDNVEALKLLNKPADTKTAQSFDKSFAEQYTTFLQDFVITGKRALYRLTLEDSMVLFISDKNFTSPVNGQPYILDISSDSSDIQVESPMLLDELIEKTAPMASKVADLEFLSFYSAYLDTLRAIHQKGLAIKKKIRRNIDITVKNKEIESKINKYETGSEYSAANDLTKFVDVVNNSKSYSEIKKSIENARNAISIVSQIYSASQFANIDSVHSTIVADIEQYNTILSEIRRLPRGINKFENEVAQLEEILSNIKKQSGSTDSEALSKLLGELEEALLFATEGKDVGVYGIFKQSRQNFGYVNGSVKSWEEE